jgi:hypothetical protein
MRSNVVNSRSRTLGMQHLCGFGGLQVTLLCVAELKPEVGEEFRGQGGLGFGS